MSTQYPILTRPKTSLWIDERSSRLYFYTETPTKIVELGEVSLADAVQAAFRILKVVSYNHPHPNLFDAEIRDRASNLYSQP